MKPLRTILLATVFLAALFTVPAFDLQAGGGNGPYKTVVIQEPFLKGCLVVRPDKIKAISEIEGPLPVLLYERSEDASDAGPEMELLTRVASYGYVIVAEPAPGGDGSLHPGNSCDSP